MWVEEGRRMFRETRGRGARVTLLKEETVAPRKRCSAGDERGAEGEEVEEDGEAVAVMSVTGWGTRRMRDRRCVASVSSGGVSVAGVGIGVDVRAA